MAWGAVIGQVLGTTGQVLGGVLGQQDQPRTETTHFSPSLSLPLQAAQFDALNQLGFGNIFDVPTPYQQFIGRLGELPSNNQAKARIQAVLAKVRKNPSLLEDLRGLNFTQQELLEAHRRGEAPDGRILRQRGDLKNLRGQFKVPTSMPVKDQGRLVDALRALGMTGPDLTALLERDKEFLEQRKRLEEAGLGRLAEETIINRANASRTASDLIGGAAQFAKTGQAVTPLQQQLLGLDNQRLQDLEQRNGILAQFGGINPAALGESLTDARLDQQLRLIEQQLGISGALQTALSGGLTAGANAASQGAGASLNSAQLAAQQAQAAANLRAQIGASNSSSLANGIANGLSSLGSGIGNAYQIGQLNRQNDLFERMLTQGNTGFSSGVNFNGPGSTYWQNQTPR